MPKLTVKVGNITLPVYAAQDRGKVRFELRYHTEIKVAIEHKIRREKFASKSAALLRAREVATAIHNGQVARLELSGDDALLLRRLDAHLAPMGKDRRYAEQLVLRAVEEWEKQQKLTGPGGVIVSDLVQQFLSAKKAEGLGDYYLRDFKLRLARLSADFPQMPFAHLTTQDLRTFLDGLNVSPRTWNNHLATVRSLAGYAVENRLIPKDWPADILAPLKAKKLAWKKPEIMTPAELRQLLDAAAQPLRRCLAVAAFCGLRIEEVHQLRWEDFKWEAAQPYIHVSEAIAKTRQHNSPLLEGLKAWIGTIETTGAFCPYKNAKVFSGMRVTLFSRLGLAGRRNPLRKSWISYRMALIQNEGQVADEAGTSIRDIHRHYRDLANIEQARQWFGVRPNYVPQNLIQLSLAAL